MKHFKTLAAQFYVLSLIPLAIQLVILVVLAFLLIQMENLAVFDEHAQTVIGQCNYLESRLSSAALTTIAYVESKHPNYKIHFQDFKLAALTTLGDLFDACSGHAAQEAEFAKLQKTSLELLRYLSEQFKSGQIEDISGKSPSANTKEEQIIGVQMAAINKLWNEFAVERRQIIAIEHERLTGIWKIDRTMVKAVCLAGIALDLLFALNLIRSVGSNVRRRLDIVRENSQRFAEEQPLLSPVEGQDEISSLDQAFHLMSERLRKALDKERMILRSTVDIICTIKQDGTFVTMNPACLTILHYSTDELIDRSVQDFVHKEDAALLLSELEQAVKSEIDRSFEACLLSRSGKLVYTSWSTRFVPSESVLFCTIRDITADKEIEQMKQEFIRMVSHDVRSPLTTVQGIFEILQHDAFLGQSEKGLPLLQKGQRSCERVMALTKDLLDIERLDSGSLQLDLQKTKLSDVLRLAAESVSGMSDRVGITIQVAQTDIEAMIDASRITQVLTNLLTNAVKFSPKGEEIRLYALEDLDMVVISVSDKGSGIPESALPYIFDRFKQVHISDSTEKGGSGLGLAICKSLVELHGGRITCRSELGKGSTFEISIPKAKSS